MNKKILLKLIYLIALIFATVIFFFQQGCSSKKKNILFIMADDHAYQAISGYGNKINQTQILIDWQTKEFVSTKLCNQYNQFAVLVEHNANGQVYSHI